MAPRSTWTGSIGFGMVSVPVKLYGAVSEQKVTFNQLHAACNARVRQERHCTSCDAVLETDDLVKG